MLNVYFEKVPRTVEAGGTTWHEDAEMYAVWDGEGAKDNGSFLGYLNLDLFPRENKCELLSSLLSFPLPLSLIQWHASRLLRWPCRCLGIDSRMGE